MSLDIRCGACPVPTGQPCVRLCDWAHSDDPMLHAHIVGRSRAGGPFPDFAAPRPIPSPAPRPATAPASILTVPRPSVTTEAELLRTMRTAGTACPYQRLCGCAHQMIRCAPEGRHPDRYVTAEFCAKCLSEQPPDVIVQGHYVPHNGYGGVVTHLADGLEARGLRVLRVPVLRHGEPRPSLDGIDPKVPLLRVSGPDVPSDDKRPLVWFSMWESSRIRTPEHLNRAAAVITPCEWCADVFRNSGVTAPIEVIPLGVGRAFRKAWLPRRDDGMFAVGMAARTKHGGVRKGLQDGVDAFRTAFRGRGNVYMLIKTQGDCVGDFTTRGDARMEVDTMPLDDEALAAWYRNLDVFLTCSYAEGFGLHLAEALACGVPGIATVYAGHRAYFGPGMGWLLPYDERPAGGVYDGLGVWGVPRSDGVVQALREAESCGVVRRARGERAACEMRSFTWSRTVKGVLRVLETVGVKTPTANQAAPVALNDMD
jgi:glycosyltransferase involved in cell wall biosynthesis